MDATGIQSSLVRIYGYDDSNQHPWGIVKVIGKPENYHFHNRSELLKLLLTDASTPNEESGPET